MNDPRVREPAANIGRDVVLIRDEQRAREGSAGAVHLVNHMSGVRAPPWEERWRRHRHDGRTREAHQIAVGARFTANIDQSAAQRVSAVRAEPNAHLAARRRCGPAHCAAAPRVLDQPNARLSSCGDLPRAGGVRPAHAGAVDSRGGAEHEKRDHDRFPEVPCQQGRRDGTTRGPERDAAEPQQESGGNGEIRLGDERHPNAPTWPHLRAGRILPARGADSVARDAWLPAPAPRFPPGPAPG